MFSFSNNLPNDERRCIIQSNAKFIESLLDGFELLELVCDKQGNVDDFVFLEVNSSYERQTGLKAADIIGKRKKKVAPAAEQRWYDYAAEAVKTGKTLSYQYYNPTVNAYYDTQFIPIPPNQIAVLFKDITAQKKVEEALKDTQIKFLNLFEQAPSVFEIYNKDGLLIQANRAWEKLWQLPRDIAVGKWNVLKSEQIEKTGLNEYVKRAYGGEVVFIPENEFDASFEPEAHGRGAKRLLNTTIYPIKNDSGEITNIVIMHQDITERKKAEEALKQTKQNLQDIIEQSPVAFAIFDNTGLLIQVNDAWVKQWQIPPELVIGKYNVLKSKQVTDTGLLPTVKRAFAGEAIKSFEIEFDASLEPQTMGAGRKRWLSVTAYPIKSETGTLNIVALTEDISERINTEDTLMKSEQRYRELYESFDEAFIVTDWEFNVTNWNKAAERVTKVPAKDALGKKVYDVLPEMLSVDITPYFQSLKDKKPARFMMNVVSRQTKKPSVFEISTYPSDLGITIIVQDKTELEESKRLSAIGATAGMVGHDIRNPLQAVLSETYLLKEDLKTMPEGETKQDVTESLDSIENNVLYINKIVQDLQDYSRPVTPEITEVNLTDVFANIFKNIIIPDSIKLSLSVKNADKIRTDLMLLQRALTNLVTNAVQAMPNGGELRIEGQRSNDRVVITVADTGVGIPEEVKPKLFTPMMTTKAKGQGFGLAVSKRLVEALKGNISFESERGKGTKFRVELPV